jgi:hypothetical protein
MQNAAAFTALKQVMAKSLEKNLKELEEMQAFFRQPIGEGEFDYDKYKEKIAKEKGEAQPEQKPTPSAKEEKAE